MAGGAIAVRPVELRALATAEHQVHRHQHRLGVRNADSPDPFDALAGVELGQPKAALSVLFRRIQRERGRIQSASGDGLITRRNRAPGVLMFERKKALDPFHQRQCFGSAAVVKVRAF